MSHYLRMTLTVQRKLLVNNHQSDIDLMYKWSQLWQIDFHVIKCYII